MCTKVDQKQAFAAIWSTTQRGLDIITELRLRPVRQHLRGRILDIGAGDGQVTEFLPGADVVSIDLTHESCRTVRAKGGPAVQADARHLPFVEASFDTCVLLDVIEHVPDPIALLKDIKRVLRPGGALICTTPNQGVSLVESFYVLWRFGTWPAERNMHIWDPLHVQRFSVERLRWYAEGAGLRVRQISLWARSGFAFGYYFADRICIKLGLPRLTRYLATIDRVLWMDTPAAILAVFEA